MKYSDQLQATINRGHRFRLAVTIACGVVGIGCIAWGGASLFRSVLALAQ